MNPKNISTQLCYAVLLWVDLLMHSKGCYQCRCLDKVKEDLCVIVVAVTASCAVAPQPLLSPSPLVDWHFFLMLPACCSIHCNHSCTATAVPNCHCLDKTKQYRFIIEVAFTTTALLSFLEPLVVIDKLFLPLCHYVQDLDGTIQYFVDQNQWI